MVTLINGFTPFINNRHDRKFCVVYLVVFNWHEIAHSHLICISMLNQKGLNIIRNLIMDVQISTKNVFSDEILKTLMKY